MEGTHQKPSNEGFEDASQFKSGADAHVEALLAGDSVTITLIGSSLRAVVPKATFLGGN